MQRRLILGVGVVLLLFATARSAQAFPQLPYVLSLGDSLSVGEQPLPSGVLVSTNQGYVDDLYAFYRITHPFLQLKKLGCSGETTATMWNGNGPCYGASSQLAQALAFIATHRVVLITISIGGDDILKCIDRAGNIDDDCVEGGIADVTLYLGQILGALRAAVGSSVPIVVANYYDPLLAAAALLPPPAGTDLADKSLVITDGLNTIIEGSLFPFGCRLADVAAAFRIHNVTIVPIINLPVNVVIALSWTWMSAPPPRGPDPHPNSTGYLAMASAFVKAIGSF